MSTSNDLTRFLNSSFPNAVSESTSESELSHVSPQIYPDTSYTDNDKVEISQWLITSAHLATPGEDEAKHAERLGSLNIHLSTRTTLLGSKPSVADLALYRRIAPAIKGWSGDERTGEKGYHHIIRHADFVQNSPLFGLSLKPDEKIDIDPSDVKFIHKPLDAKEEKERKKKEKAAAAAAAAGSPESQTALPIGKGKDKSSNKAQPNETPTEAAAASTTPPQPKKEKKDRPPKQPKAVPAPTPLSPHLIDLRVGHILKCIPHPDADSLYVSTIACGDPAGTDNTSTYEDGQVVRTVCSGLNGLVPLEEMQGRKVVAVCNLKPVTMRGIKSAAMVLAASPRLKEGEVDDHKGPVELVEVPEAAVAGERVGFEGWEGEPEGVLNPKKKVWEGLQPGFTTTENSEVGFDAGVVDALGEARRGKGVGLLRTGQGGLCRVPSLKGAVVR